MGYIGIGKDYLVDSLFLKQSGEIRLRQNRYSLRIPGTGQLRRVTAALDIRDLSGGKGHHLYILPVA